MDSINYEKACVCCNEAAEWRLGAAAGAGHCTASVGVDSKTRLA